MKVDTNQNVSDLLNVFFTHGLLPTVKRPTRITHTSSTVIDNIHAKFRGYENVDSRIILSDISDQYFNKILDEHAPTKTIVIPQGL